MSDADDELEARLAMSILDVMVNGGRRHYVCNNRACTQPTCRAVRQLAQGEGDDDGGIPE